MLLKSPIGLFVFISMYSVKGIGENNTRDQYDLKRYSTYKSLFERNCSAVDNLLDHDGTGGRILRPTIRVANYSYDKNWNDDWEVVELSDRKQGIIAKHKNFLVLKLVCTALYPVKLEVHDNEIIKEGHKRMRKCETPAIYQYENEIRSSISSYNFQPLTSTIEKITCGNANYPLHYRIIHIFVPGEKVLVKSGENLTYSEMDIYIKCFTTDPRMSPLLFIEHPETGSLQELNTTSCYNPLYGFKLNRNAEHVFLCFAGENDTVRFIPENKYSLSSGSTQSEPSIFTEPEGVPEILVNNYLNKRPWKADWEIVDLENNATNVVAKRIAGTLVLYLVCTAPFPIEWDEYQYNDFRDSASTYGACDKPPQIMNGMLIHSQTLTVYFHHGISPSPIKMFCLRTRVSPKSNLAKFSTINIFIPSKRPLFVNIKKPNTYLAGYKNIPCAVTDPRISVNLLFEDTKTGITNHVNNATFDPSRGFILQNGAKGGGVYVCATKQKEHIRIKELRYFFSGFRIYKRHLVQKCENGDGALIISKDAEYEKNQTFKGLDWSFERIFLRHWTSLITQKPNVESEEEEIAVVPTFSAWPKIDVYCLKHDQLLFSKIRMTGRLLKKYQVKLMNPVDSENITSDNSFHLFSNVTVREAKHFLTWEEFSYEEFIFMLAEGERTLHTNTTSRFTCKTGRQLSSNLTFWMETSDGNSTQLFQGFQPPVKIKLEDRPHFQFKSWTLLIELPIDTVAIHCKVPTVIDPGLYLGGGKRFETKDLLSPKIMTKQSYFEFVIGQTNKNLVCFAIGEPRPIQYAWKKNNEPLENIQETEIALGKNGESIVIFKTIQIYHIGTYSCSAFNRMGKDNLEFSVFVKEDPKDIQLRLKKIVTSVFVVSILVGAVTICAIGIFRHYVTKQIITFLNKNSLRGLSDEETQDFFSGRENNKNSTKHDFDVFPYDTRLEIDENDMCLDYNNILGVGEFAVVIKGFINSKETNVAVKILKRTADINSFKALLSEVKVLSYIGRHPNIVGLVGVTTKDIKNRNLYIHLDFCELGSLEKFLRADTHEFVNLLDENGIIIPALTHLKYSKKVITSVDLIRWSANIAMGMEYLSDYEIIHADLALRNVLLTQNKIARISDFGMSKGLLNCSSFVKMSKNPLPWRWLALESLTTMTFSTQSDVWSYGITLWELFSLGDVPFPNEQWNDTFVQKLASGVRLGQPKFSTSQIYSKIVGCWEEIPSKRPDFAKLRNYFCDLLSSLVYATPAKNEDFCTV